MEGKLATLKILVVDDELSLTELLKTMFEAYDCEVIIATDGKQALDIIRKTRPDAVFLDILMPVLDGMDTLEIIRKTDKTLPIYMITAFSTAGRVAKAKKIGATGYLLKDADLKKGIGRIIKSLRNHGA